MDISLGDLPQVELGYVWIMLFIMSQVTIVPQSDPDRAETSERA